MSMDVMLSRGEISFREEFKAFLEDLDLSFILRMDKEGRRGSSRILSVTRRRITTRESPFQRREAGEVLKRPAPIWHRSSMGRLATGVTNARIYVERTPLR
jgi:hypothetical protein